jgi:hypothetical protein
VLELSFLERNLEGEDRGLDIVSELLYLSGTEDIFLVRTNLVFTLEFVFFSELFLLYFLNSWSLIFYPTQLTEIWNIEKIFLCPSNFATKSAMDHFDCFALTIEGQVILFANLFFLAIN